MLILRRSRDGKPAIIERFAEEILLKRFADVDEIASFAAFVMPPRASNVLGQSIDVDGGTARGVL